MIENQANAILSQYWDGNLPVNLDSIANRIQAEVHYRHDMGGASGIVSRQNGRPIIYVNANDAVVRRRFTIAHEIGHWLLGHLKEDGQSLPRDDGMTYSSMSSSLLEREANQFAAALLMPADAVKYVLQSGYATTLDALARTFGVSKSAMQYRINNLGLFNAI